ncbi:MAG: hypothetical protein ABFS42_09565 [Candidatus Krumholzibacteriota bacterium]
MFLITGILLLQAGVAGAQTPDEACAADSLYLISPEMLDLRLETTGRKGLTISWPNMDLAQATCFSLKNTEGLGFEVNVTGGFGDRVDRQFNFDSKDNDEGAIGGLQPDNIIVTWQNSGPTTYGTVGGQINLANNGGIWRHNAGTGWSQVNNQLPMYWLKTNTVGLATGSGGFMVAGFTRGVTAESDPAGLFTFDGSAWTRIAWEEDPDIADQVIFDKTKLITGVAVSPADNDMFAVGTARDGLYITTDGGLTFDQWTMQLDPAYPDMPTNFHVNLVEWSGNRVFVFINNFGLFISQDNGASFTRSDFEVPETLDVPLPDRTMIMPVINSLSFHPTNPDRIAASLQFHGVYESTDGGVTWNDLYGDLLVPDPDPDISGAWVNSALDCQYDDVSDQTLVMGIKQKGLFRTTDGGATWVLVGDSVQPENRAKILDLDMTRQPGTPGSLFVLEDGYALLHSSDSGATWEHFSSQPMISKGFFIVGAADGSGDMIMGSWGGGTYIPGNSLPLTATYTSITSPELRDMDLGLSITFSAGQFMAGDEFDLVCQTFQGWAVWRGPSHRPQDMTLLGLFDRVNPEDCFEGYCGDLNIEPVPNCFEAKRAACFNVDNPDTIRFFDEEIYNGFTYNYAVTSFDYGNTALATPENNTNDMVFSPRFEGDLVGQGGISPFPGPGNQTPIQINEPLIVGEEGLEEIYVFPNPVRQGAGFPRDEGGTVTFRNIPTGSKILVFTSAGDRIIDLEPDIIQAGNMHWDTRNSSGESIVSGIYIYKVEIPEMDDYWGRLVVIR